MIDENKTSPYEFYHYWRNIDDADVENCLALLTLPMDEARLGSHKDNRINEAKSVLAFEVTKLVHGEEKAMKSPDAEQALFAGNGSGDNIPSVTMKTADFSDGINILDLYLKACLISKVRGRRLMAKWHKNQRGGDGF